MIGQFPRLPPATGAADVGELQRMLWEYASRVQDYLATLPPTEYVTIATSATFPLYVKTQLSAPQEVCRCRTYATRSGAPVDDTSIAWTLAVDPKQAGNVRIDAMGGLTAGTDYTVILAIRGVRK
jgi:hypothetical protein